MMLGLLLLTAISTTTSAGSSPFTVDSLTVDRRACTSDTPLFVEPAARFSVEFALACANTSTTCRGAALAGHAITLADAATGALVHDSGDVNTTSRRAMLAAKLAPDTVYVLTVRVRGAVGGGWSGAAACRLQTALAPASAWAGADWVGGGTALRSSFTAEKVLPVTATLYASGLGCFSLQLNGASVTGASHDVGQPLMDPGWSTIPNMRLLYTGATRCCCASPHAAAHSSLTPVPALALQLTT